ncbi:MAG: hypothetical protein JO166_10210 [Deltaproteobacteria bacterium]|nr:hypothetical protein [Deltaproteobacteria bacterium]
MINNLALSLVFVACQLAFMAIFGGALLSKGPVTPETGRWPRRIKRAVFGLIASAAIITGVVDITSAALQQRREAAVNAGELLSQAQLGKPLLVRLDSEACAKWDLGTIACNTDYRASYDSRAARWTVSGYSNSDKAVITSSTRYSEGAGSLSIWGALFRFDNSGMVYRFNQIAGKIRVAPVLDQQTVKP